MNDAGLPVPDEQPIIKYLATPGHHAKKITAYFMFAISQRRRESRRFQIKYTPVG